MDQIIEQRIEYLQRKISQLVKHKLKMRETFYDNGVILSGMLEQYDDTMTSIDNEISQVNAAVDELTFILKVIMYDDFKKSGEQT